MVIVGVVLTPAWLAPPWLARPWLVLTLLFSIPAIFLSWRFAPWVPTPRAELPRLLRCMELDPSKTFCEIGAGDGRMMVWVHRQTGAQCTGLELSPLMFLVGWVRVAVRRAGRLRFVDMYKADLSGFDVLYVWGTAYWVGTPEFADYLRGALKPGARLVSYQQPLADWAPDLVDNEGQRPIYVYSRAADAPGLVRGRPGTTPGVR